MTPDDVLISFVDISVVCPCPGYDRTDMPLSLEEADFTAPFDVWNEAPPRPDDVPTSHAFARRTFQTNRRSVDLWVEFGQDPPADVQRDLVNKLLGSVTIGDYLQPLTPDGLCNSWSTSKDPDCPISAWIRLLLREAAFDVIDSRQEQTLVGQGGGARFYISAREQPYRAEEVGPHVYTIGGISVFGGESELAWDAQGLLVRVAAGPFGGDQLPKAAGVARLVKASLTVQIPQE
jgi:hypothetical protein